MAGRSRRQLTPRPLRLRSVGRRRRRGTVRGDAWAKGHRFAPFERGDERGRAPGLTPQKPQAAVVETA